MRQPRKENKIVVMANYRRIVAFNMCLHMLVLCSIYNQCTDTFSLLLHATTSCPIQIPACYKKRVLASTKFISNSLFSKILILIILVADFSLWLSILLLYCGDIHPNHGPFSSSSDSFDSSNTPGPSFSSISLNLNLSFVHYNVQSIVNKLDILHAQLLDFDNLAFTETWLSPAVSTNDLMLQSYNIPERKDRTGDPHGGVIVYVKNGIFYKRREDLEIRGLECHLEKYELDKIQNEAARIATGVTKLVSLTNLYKEIGWESLSKRRSNHKLTLLYKMINHLTPIYLSSLIPAQVSSASRYNLRNAQNYQTIRARTNQYRDSFLPSTLHLWNNLPLEARQSNTLNSFKLFLKKTSYQFLDITIMEIEDLKYFTHVYEQAAVHLI